MAKKEILNNDLATVRIGETAADIIEETQDVIEQTLDVIENTAEKVVTVTKNNPLVLAGAFVVGAAIGGFVAYKWTEKRMTVKYETIIEEQVAAARSFTMRLQKEGELSTPESAVQALHPEEAVVEEETPNEVSEAIRTYQGQIPTVPYNKPDLIEDPRPPVETVIVEHNEVTQNVFVTAERPEPEPLYDPRDWNQELEEADREAAPGQPYVISFKEFDEGEASEQISLTYYVEDDTLCDSRDQPIDNTDYLVGDDNLSRFGHGSNDPNVVYIRNENTDVDYEISLNRTSYQEAVLGTKPEPELSHARRRPNRRQWSADE